MNIEAKSEVSDRLIGAAAATDSLNKPAQDDQAFANALKVAQPLAPAVPASAKAAMIQNQTKPTVDVNQLINGLSSDASNTHGAEEVEALFSQFVGETFFGQLVKQMRATVKENPYFHGGRAEEMFSSQLDQQFAQMMAAEYGDELSAPMLDRMKATTVLDA